MAFADPTPSETAKACCTAPAPPTSPPLDRVAWCHLTILGIAGLIAWIAKTPAELYMKHRIENQYTLAKIDRESKSVLDGVKQLHAAGAKLPAQIGDLETKLNSIIEAIEKALKKP